MLYVPRATHKTAFAVGRLCMLTPSQRRVCGRKNVSTGSGQSHHGYRLILRDVLPPFYDIPGTWYPFFFSFSVGIHDNVFLSHCCGLWQCVGDKYIDLFWSPVMYRPKYMTSAMLSSTVPARCYPPPPPRDVILYRPRAMLSTVSVSTRWCA